MRLRFAIFLAGLLALPCGLLQAAPNVPAPAPNIQDSLRDQAFGADRLQDPDARIRRRAVDALVRQALRTTLAPADRANIPAPGRLKALIVQLGHDDFDRRIAAQDELRRWVVFALDDLETATRARYKLTDTAFVALRSDKVPDEVLEKLIRLKEKEFELEPFLEELRNSLGRSERKRFQQFILADATTLDSEVARLAGELLTELYGGPGQPPIPALAGSHQMPADPLVHLAYALQDSDRGVRRAAAMGLVQAFHADVDDSDVPDLTRPGMQTVLSALLYTTLHEENEDVRLSTARVLARMGPAAVRVLALALNSEEPDVRLNASRAFAGLGAQGRQAMTQLIPLLSSTSDEMRQNAARALGQMGKSSMPAEEALQKATTEGNTTSRALAAQALFRINGRSDVIMPILWDAMKDSEWKVARIALDTFDEMKGAGTVELLSALEEKDVNLRWWVVYALGKKSRGTKEVVASLLKILEEDEDKELRAEAASALGNLEGNARSAAPALLKALKGPEASVRAKAAKALGEIGVADRDVLEGLMGAVVDESSTIQIAGLKALARLGREARETAPVLQARLLAARDERIELRTAVALWSVTGENTESIPVLLRLLQSGETKMQIEAALALWQVAKKTEETLPVLAAALRDNNPEVRQEAVQALAEVGGDARLAAAALLEAMDDESSVLREWAADVLGQIRPTTRPAIPVLVKSLQDQNTWVRKWSAISLGKMGNEAEDALPALREALKDQDNRVRVRAAEALWLIASEVHPDVLAEILTDPTTTDVGRSSAETAALILILMGPRAKSVAPDVRKALDDPRPTVRMRAAEALFRIELDRPNLKVFVDCLKHEEESVRQEAAETLGKLGPDARPVLADLEPLLKDESPTVRKSVAEAIKNITQAVARK
jgi:HEAT repeat protein